VLDQWNAQPMKERIGIFGDSASRPEGLVRALTRAGFLLAECEAGDAKDSPDLALVAVPDAGAALEHALGFLQERGWGGVPVIVLLSKSEPGGITRALALGAADAVAAPVDLAELCARLEARLRFRAEMLRAAGAGALQAEMFQAIEEVASSQRPDEMLQKLVRRLGVGLGADHCACLMPSPDGRCARLVAVHENPALRDIIVDLFHYPEAVEAVVSGRTVHAPEVLRDGLFLAHLAQWPDSPQVREIESAAAVPLITHRVVRAVVVIRTRRGESPLTTEQVGLVEKLVNSVAALLEREHDRSADAQRQGLAAVTDPLTGCATSETLERRLRPEMERVRRYGARLAYVALGVDPLRELVARDGPRAGDAFLAELGSLLTDELRSPDLVARHGNEGFALLLPESGPDEARTVVNRLSARIQARTWEHLGLPEPPRISAGIATFPYPGIARAEDLFAAAEADLAGAPMGQSAA
jgi:diguanylate cyclase (GGDEF)-like protein